MSNYSLQVIVSTERSLNLAAFKMLCSLWPIYTSAQSVTIKFTQLAHASVARVYATNIDNNSLQHVLNCKIDY